MNQGSEELDDERDINAICQQENEEEQGKAKLISIDEDELKDWASGDL